MERKTTKLKYLLLITAMLLGMNIFAQQVAPVNKAPAPTTTVQSYDAVSKYKPANWNLESEVSTALQSTQTGSSLSAKPAQAQTDFAATPESQAQYEQQKLAMIAAENESIERAPGLAEHNYQPSATDAVWDLLMEVPTAAVGQTGIETNGESIWTGYWATAGQFSKYTTTGALVETFTIPGGPLTRDLAYDGQYFYATANSNLIYKLDLVNHLLIGTINTSVAGCRHICYDPTLDGGAGGFWVGAWVSGTLYAVSMTGATLFNVPSFNLYGPYGSAYDPNTPGGPYVWFFDQDGNGVDLVRLNTTTFAQSLEHDASADLVNFVLGSTIAGGLASSPSLVPSKLVLLGMAQGAPNVIFEYEIATTIVYPNDVGIKALNAPTSSTNLSATQPVTVTIQNYGSQPVTNIPVYYTLNGGPVVNGQYNGTLAAGATVTYTFPTTANMFLYGNYVINACTALPGDQQASNDCKSFNVTHIIPTVTDTLNPFNLAKSTGTTTGTAFSETSLIKFYSDNSQQGWAKFDISPLPVGVVLNSAHVFYNVSDTYIPYFDLTHLTIDPMAAGSTPAAVKNGIASGTIYNNLTSGYALGWHDITMPAAALTDISNATTTGNWWALGFYEYEGYSGYYATVDGWAQTTTKPYVVVNYTPPLAHDAGVVSIDMEPFILFGNTAVVATVKNFGSNIESFTVTATGPLGYTCTKSVANLNPGASTVVTFDSPMWNATPGNATLTVCTNLGNDLSLSNNCKSKTVKVEAKLTLAYAYNAYDPSGALVEGPVKFFLEHPEVITQLGPTVSPDFISGGTWANGTWYGVGYYSGSGTPNSLWTINTTTGAMTQVGYVAPNGRNLNGLTYDPVHNIMFAVGETYGNLGTYSSQLFTVNMSTGAITQVANLGNIGLLVNLAISPGGELYATDLITDRIYVIDPETPYHYEFVRVTNQPFNYAQDAEFENGSGILYFAGYTTTGQLITYNSFNGVMNTIGNFQGGAEITGFAIPYSNETLPVDIGIQWMEYPRAGNLTNGEPVIIRVRNYGSTSVENFDLAYKFMNDPIVTENWQSMVGFPLDPGTSFDYAFIPVVDLSTPNITYHVKSWVYNCPGDTRHVNDTVFKYVANTSCGVITCLPGAIDEPEPCGFDLNGGCNSTPEAFINITNGQAYCGTSWKIDTLRDTDWYRFTLTSTKTAVFKGTSEFNADFILVKLPCSGDSVVASKTFNKCISDSLVSNALVPGEYALVVVENWIDDDMTCSSHNKYTFNFQLRPPKYCTAGSSYTNCDEYISSVIVGTINNSTNCIGGTNYANYTATQATSMTVGQSYPITVTNGNPYSSDQCGVWIDWNQNYSFYDVGEKVAMNGSPGNGPYTGTITPPANALPGPTTMRVRITWTGVLDPCGITSYGEVEDYRINVTAPIPPVTTYAPVATETCPGVKNVPITVDNFTNINGFHLVLGYSAGATYTTYTNVNSALASGTLVLTPGFGSVSADWFSATPTTIVTGGKLFDLVFTTVYNAPTSGAIQLVWQTSGPEASYYTNLVLGNLPTTYTNGSLTYGQCSNLDGMVYYDRIDNNNPMKTNANGTTTVTLSQGTSVVYSTPTTATGSYHFGSLNNGTYTLKTTTTRPWGYCNSTDALGILKHFVQMQLLTGLRLVAADVNQYTGVNAADALAVAKRFVGQSTNFTHPITGAIQPDWYSETYTIVVDGTNNQVQDVRMLCSGDVNRSGNPSKDAQTVNIQQEGTQLIDGITSVPVYAQNNMNVGAISLVLTYPKSIEIQEVNMTNTPENLTYVAKDGNLRLSWFSTEPLNLKAGDVMMTFKVKANTANVDANFFTNEESQIASEEGVTIDNATLLMPKLVSNAGDADYSLNNFPNPFAQTTRISYTLPQAGNVSLKVFNVLGEEVATLVKEDQTMGTHFVTFDGSKVQRGVYYYKLEVNGVTKTKSMVISD